MGYMSNVYMDRMIESARRRRWRVVELRRAGVSMTEVARVLGVSRPAVYRLWNEAVRKGEVPDS
jgi:DNA invertase Pin-like site-specific DNA recombinase